MISLKEYAELNHITYEAVRSQVKRYREQLEDHIIQDGRTQYLDDIAVAFLDERRQKNPVVMYQQSKDEAIEEMRRKLEGAYQTIAVLQEFKIQTLESRQALEDARTAQDRRERELEAREGRMAQELAEAAQKAAEAAREEAKKEREILEGFIQDAKDELAAAHADHEAAIAEQKAKHQKTIDEMSEEMGSLLEEQIEQAKQLEEKDKKIQELENRTFGDYLKALFRKKGKEESWQIK